MTTSKPSASSVHCFAFFVGYTSCLMVFLFYRMMCDLTDNLLIQFIAVSFDAVLSYFSVVPILAYLIRDTTE